MANTMDLDQATLIGAIMALSGGIVALWKRQESEHDIRRSELIEARAIIEQLKIEIDALEDERDTTTRRCEKLEAIMRDNGIETDA